MSFLTEERRSRLRLLLHTVAEGQRDHEEIARLDAQIRLDYHGRFLIELVQNAVDPAQRAGLESAHILVIRTARHLAVLNQGTPFDEAGLRSILSLALSSKRPDEAIGNKGVGFKSVFEVAEAAEVYGVSDPGSALGRAPPVRFRVRRAGAEPPESLVAEATSLLDEDPRLAQQIASRSPGGDTGLTVRRALAASPAWRYPEELSVDAWTETARALGLGKADLAKYQTAVVLQLDDQHQANVDRAVGDFTSGAAEVHLFLPAVGRIEVREDAGTTTLERADLAKCSTSGVILRRLRGRFRDGSKTESSWWIAAGTVAGATLEAAVAALPGEGWQSVRRAEVQVALPVPTDDGALATSGRYYVGLPTRELTGSPFHVDARFHATLSRTGLDRRDNAYNVLLDREAARAAATLVRALRSATKGTSTYPNLGAARRAVTLALAGSTADRAFAIAVRGHLRDEPVVLLDDGERFTVPLLARRVPDEDAAVIDLIEERLGAKALTEHGVELVERSIKASSSGLLAELGVPALKPTELLARASGGASVVERLAAKLARPDDGWTTLLSWFAGRIPAGGEDQRLLPITGGDLVTIQDRPFLPLQSAPLEGELQTGDVPPELLAHLPFIDAAVLTGKDELRRVLAEGQRPIAQRAIASAAVRLAVVPAINRAVEAGEDVRGRELLTLALRLLASVAGSEDVRGYGWRVPCGSGWLPADEAYLGDAWDDERKAEDAPGIAETAFASSGRCMVPWWGSAGDRPKVRQALLRIGLDDSPRIWVYEPVQAAIWGDYRQGAPQRVAPPGVVPEEVWRAYLVFLCQSAAVDWGPQTWWRLEGVEWVDGLERADIAPLVAAWALSQKADPASLLPTNPRRYKTGAHVAQPWPFAVGRLETACVPSHPSCSLKGRLARPSELCRVPPASKDVPPWLPRAADDLNAETLASVGVRALHEMPASWLVAQLSAFASTLDPDKKHGVVARGLWRLLNARARTEPLGGLADAVLPVWRGGTVVAVRGSELARVVIVDDAYDAEVLGDQLDGVHLLDPENEDWTALARRIREGLPGATVELVSELDYPYQAEASVPAQSLVGLVVEAFGAAAIAAVAALLRMPRAGVGNKDIERAWTAFGSAKVQIGVLPPGAPPAVWLDGDNTLICQEIDPADVVVALWPVVGAAWRHPLLALGHALGRGDRAFRDFLRHEGITELMLDEAASRLGAAKLIAPFLRPEGASVLRTSPALVLVPVDGGDGDASADDAEEPIDLDAARELVRLAPAVLDGQLNGVGAPSRTIPASTVSTRRGTHGDEDYARQIGHFGEHFAFRALSAMLRGFDESCWKSSSRSLAGLPGGDDTLGFDFHYVDVDGTLTGERGAECFIEVKANARRARPRFTLSNNEWKLAQRCHGTTTQRFIILRVAGIGDAPEVAAIIVDPVRAVGAGELVLTPKDGWWVDHQVGDAPVLELRADEATDETAR